MSTITSLRIKSDVKQQLELASKSLHRSVNWILNQAIHNYLLSLELSKLADEAKRQSLLASHKANPDEKLWEENSDTTDWQ